MLRVPAKSIMVAVFVDCMAPPVLASALEGPTCFVTADIIKIDTKSHHLFLKITGVDGNFPFPFLGAWLTRKCPAQKDQVFKTFGHHYVSDGHQAGLKEGDRIRAGIELSSTMSPVGPVVSFLHWSNVKFVNGKPIGKGKEIVDYFQTSDKPEHQN